MNLWSWCRQSEVLQIAGMDQVDISLGNAVMVRHWGTFILWVVCIWWGKMKWCSKSWCRDRALKSFLFLKGIMYKLKWGSLFDMRQPNKPLPLTTYHSFYYSKKNLHRDQQKFVCKLKVWVKKNLTVSCSVSNPFAFCKFCFGYKLLDKLRLGIQLRTCEQFSYWDSERTF